MAASLGWRHLEVLTSSSHFLFLSLSLCVSLEYQVHVAEAPRAFRVHGKPLHPGP